MVDRWRAGRRQLMANWALAGVPRGRRGDPPAAAVRGAEHLLAHGTCVSAWLPLTPLAPVVAAQVAVPRRRRRQRVPLAAVGRVGSEWVC